MALSGKLKAAFEVKSSAEKFYGMRKKEPHHVPKHTPNIIKHVKPHEHDWDSHDHGSVKIRHYTIEGTEESLKERVEFDDRKKMVTITGLEGHPMNFYKLFKATWHATPKGTSSLVKCIQEYEGRDETIPTPYRYFTIFINIMKDVDKGLIKN